MAVVFPTAPAPGQVVTDPANNVTWRWDATGQRWVPAATGGVFLPIAGGTMTGPLELAADAAAPMEAVTLQQLEEIATGHAVVSSDTAPPPPNTVGDLWFDTVNRVMMVYQGGTWVAAGAGDITGFLPLTGGVLSNPGHLTILGNLAINAVDVRFLWGPSPGAFFGGYLWYQSANNSTNFITRDSTDGQFGWYWQGTAGDFDWFRPNGTGAITVRWRMRNSDAVFASLVGPVSGNGAYVNASDRRMKTAIESEDRGLELIDQIRVRAFERSAQPRAAMTAPDGRAYPQRRRREIGFIADELAGVLPEAVVPFDDPETSDPMMGVTSETIVAILVNAVKELSLRIKTLEAKT